MCRPNKCPVCTDDINEALKWNVIETFQLPLDPGNYWTIQDLERESFEFKYVAYKFLKTFTGINPIFDDIPQTVEAMMKE